MYCIADIPVYSCQAQGKYVIQNVAPQALFEIVLSWFVTNMDMWHSPVESCATQAVILRNCVAEAQDSQQSCAGNR